LIRVGNDRQVHDGTGGGSIGEVLGREGDTIFALRHVEAGVEEGLISGLENNTLGEKNNDEIKYSKYLSLLVSNAEEISKLRQNIIFDHLREKIEQTFPDFEQKYNTPPQYIITSSNEFYPTGAQIESTMVSTGIIPQQSQQQCGKNIQNLQPNLVSL